MIKKISVTLEDIEEGKPGDEKECALARAIKRTFKGWKQKVIVCGIVTVGKYTAKLPKDAIDFIGAYDDNDAVEPFDVTLEFSRM